MRDHKDGDMSEELSDLMKYLLDNAKQIDGAANAGNMQARNVRGWFRQWLKTGNEKPLIAAVNEYRKIEEDEAVRNRMYPCAAVIRMSEENKKRWK